MAYPTTIVEIAFTSGPYVVSPTWVDVTSYVREITTRRGRSDEFQNFEAGTATIVLDNRDRRFDPMNTAGPYYGNLLPRRQIRIRGTATTTPIGVFRGYVSGWPVEITDAGFDSTVSLECFDAMGLLSQEEIPDDIAENYILSTSPRHYWPLTDPIDPATYQTQVLKDYGTSPNDLTSLQLIRTSNAAGLAIGIPDTSIAISENEFIEGWYFQKSPLSTPVDQSFSMWFQLPTGDANFIFASYGISHEVELAYDKTNSLLQIFTYNGTQQRTYEAPVFLDVSQAHFVALVTYSSGLLFYIQLDGQRVFPTLTSTVAWTDPLSETYATCPGRHQQAVLWASNISYFVMLDIYRLGLNKLTESVYNRLTRLESFTSFPSSMITTDIIPTTVTRTNLITNPSIETNTTGWTGTAGATLTRTTAKALYGSSSIISNRTSTTGALVVGFNPRLAVSAGLPYTFSAYFFRDYATTRITQLRTQWFDAASVLIGSTIIVGQTVPPINTWGRLSTTQTAPAGAVTVYFDVLVNGALVGENVWLDGMLLEQSAALNSYFDGSLADSYTNYQLVTTAWNGTAQNSTSTANFTQSSPYQKVTEITTGGPNIMNEIQLLADSEGGNAFVTKDGNIFLTSQNSFSIGTSLTSQATFGGAGITIGPAIQYSLDADTMRNSLTMTYSGDGSLVYEDSTSITTYGFQGGTWNTQLDSQDSARALATMLVNFSKDPKLVISPIEVNVAGVLASWETILNLELLQRITLNIVPRTGSTITTQQLIQSIEHRITPSQWSTTINGSVRYTNVFIIGSSLIGGPDLIA